MICTNKGRSILIAGGIKLYPGESREFHTVSEASMKAFRYFASRGLAELSGIEEAPAPVVVESAPEHSVAVDAPAQPAEEAPAIVESVEATADPVSEQEAAEGTKKRRNRK